VTEPCMYFIAGFYDATILLEAAGHSLRGRFPHLRLCPVEEIPYLREILSSIPGHISTIVLSPVVSRPGVNVLLSCGTMPIPSYLVFPEQRVVNWQELEDAYTVWMESVYLLRNAVRMTCSPLALKPVGEVLTSLDVELIGGCGAQELQLKFQEFAREMGVESRAVLTVRNVPVQVESSEAGASAGERLRIVMPPFRFMHPANMDLFYYVQDSDLFFEEARQRLHEYLGAFLPCDTATPCFVIGFIVPMHNPMGLFIESNGKSDLRCFVDALNDEIRGWCADHPSTFFVDGDVLAQGVGKGRVDDGLVNFYGHRGFLLDYDGPLDEEFPVTDNSVTKSFDIGIDLYLEHLVREILLRRIIMTSEAKIKLVILDLDNTLWRGLASDMRLGSWEGRPVALVEALLILKKRGILLAIASKNDEDFIREQWFKLLGSHAISRLVIPLSLDDFVMVRINFRPKAENIGEILEALNVLPEHALFIDDNPLEREAAIAAFPALRTLGAEPNYIRRELLCSPYLQNVSITGDDMTRSKAIRKRVEYWESHTQGETGSYLDHLGLRCMISSVGPDDNTAGERAFQLLNKTNQWNLNGIRVDAAQLARYHEMERLYVAEVADSGSSYGTVVVMLLNEERTVVEFMAISCRVIGMGVDEAVVSEMVRRFGPLEFAFVETDRNRAARSFFQRCENREEMSVPRIEVLEHPRYISML
jgi:FkbH-like protein